MFCQCAMWVTMPLPRKEYSLKQPLEDGMMHIISTVSGKSCKLLPLIKFGESPSKDNNACYFYNRRDNDHSQKWISYHNENNYTLQDINLDIEEKSIQVVMGLSGSGKSTLIRHINRLIEPTDGSVTIDGIEVLKMNEEELRNFRILQYNMGKNITGNDTANFLQKYAEIGYKYVVKVKEMIRENKLSKFENSKLIVY